MSLEIKDKAAVSLAGYFDDQRQLQFRYGEEELSPHGDSVVVYSDDAVRVTLESPAGATIRATHEQGRETVTWTPAQGGVVHTFATGMTDPAEVEAEAEPSPPKGVFVHIKPTGGLPDT